MGGLQAGLAAVLMLTLPANAAAAPIHKSGNAYEPLKDRIRAGEFPNVHSLIIERNGRRVGESYFAGPDERDGKAIGTVTFNANTLHDIRSISKSIVSLLFGIAVSDGAIKSLDTPVLDYFPEYTDLRDAQHLKIRLRDLLSMTSGLAWDEETYSYTDARNSEAMVDAAPDRYHYILSRAIEAQPGTRWRYSGGDVQLIAEVIARATKTRIDTYAETKLFAPLGIVHFEWVQDRKRIPYASSGLRLTPRDMLKLGELMLNRGRFEGKQVVPAAWVKQATASHAGIVGTRGSADKCELEYGYYWWLAPKCHGKPFLFGGIGNGAQRIIVAPSTRTIVVMTAGLYNDPRQDKTSYDLIEAALVRR